MDDKPTIGTPANKGNPNLTQSWYDENRELFGAETTIAQLSTEKCPHQGFLFRDPEKWVKCSRCNAGWYFPLSVAIVDGKIVS